MVASRLSPARLNGSLAQELRTLEVRFGCWIVAYQYEAQLAQLSRADYAQVEELEQHLGVSLVAYESSARCQVAHPSPHQLERIHALERELDLILIAYHHEHAPTAQLTTLAPGQQLAKLAEDQYERLHQIEEQTGLVLMAYAA
jgi:hypothetical protein